MQHVLKDHDREQRQDEYKHWNSIDSDGTVFTIIRIIIIIIIIIIG